MKHNIYCILLLCISSIVHAQTTPDKLPNLAAWWSADSITVGDGNPIETWTTNNNEYLYVTQPIADCRPILVNNVLNGKPVVRFDGVDDYLDGGDILNIGSEGATFFVIAKSNVSNAAYISKSLYGNQPNRYAIEYDAQWSEGFLFLHHDNVTNNSIETEKNPFGNNEMITVTVNNANKTNALFINGFLIDSKAISGLAMSSPFNFLIGGYNNTLGFTPPQDEYYLDGDIAEIIIYDRPLSQLERQEIENYLRLKYFPSEYRPPIDLGADIIESYNLAPITISVPVEPYYVSYEWNTGATTPSIDVTESGTYWVTVFDDWGYIYSDTIRVQKPDITAISDTTLCAGETLVWDCGLSGAYTYNWSTGESSQSISISSANDYWVNVQDSFGAMLYSDTVHVAVSTFAQEASLGPDTASCQGNSIELLTRKDDAHSYLWNDGSTKPKFVVNTAGTYSVIVSDIYGCTLYDTIEVTIKGLAPEVRISAENLCFGQSTKLENITVPTDGTAVIATQWVLGADTLTGTVIHKTFSQTGTNTMRVITETESGCFGILDTSVYIGQVPISHFSPPRACTHNNIEFINTGTIQSGYIQNSIWNINGMSYSGNSFTHSFDTIGVYPVYLQSISNLGCTHDTTITVEVRESAELQFVYNKTCQNEKMFFFDKTTYKPENSPVDGNWYVNDVEFPQYSVFGKTFTTPGKYAIALEVTTINGCTNRVSDTITIYEAPVFDSLKIYGCNLQEITLQEYTNTFNQDIVSYTWDIDSIGIRVEKKPVVVYKNTGIYPFTLEITTEHECIGKAQGKIYVQEPPVADFTFYPEFGAAPLEVEFFNTSEGAVAYSWRFEENAISNETNPRYEFSLLDTSYAHLTVFSSYNCVDSISKHIPIDLKDQQIKIMSVSYRITDRGFLQYTVQVANTGNAPIHMIEFLLENPNFPTIAEIWKGFLEVGSSLTYSFVSTTKMAENKTPPYLCVIGNIISQDIYKIYYADSMCVDFNNKLTLFSIAPNPADDFITVTLSTPDEGDFSIECYNAQGKVCSKQVFTNVTAGIQQIQIETHNLSVGIYTLRVKKGAKKIDSQFIISR